MSSVDEPPVDDGPGVEDLDEALSPTRVQATTERFGSWGGRVARAAAWFAVAGSAAAAATAWRALPSGAALVVTILAAVPAIAALVLRARLVWLIGALPTALTELRSLAATRQAQTAGDDPEARDLRDRVQALQRQLAGTKRRSLITLIRVIKLVRSPATQALQLTRGSIGSVERIETTAQVVDRSAGLPFLAVATTVGSLVAWVVAAILLVVGSI